MKTFLSSLVLAWLFTASTLQQGPIRIDSSVAEGKLLGIVCPTYPQGALKTRLEGDVELDALIRKDGHVKKLITLSGDPILAAAAVAAVSRWRYHRYLLNDVPVEVQTRITVRFRLPAVIPEHPADSLGSVCIAPVAAPTPGPKSLANPTGGNSVRSYAVRVDDLPRLEISRTEKASVYGLSVNRRHLVRIYGDSKLRESFRFRYSDYASTDLCLWFNPLYETWSLWDAHNGGAKCQCPEASAARTF